VPKAPQPIGSFGVNENGLLDVAGNGQAIGAPVHGFEIRPAFAMDPGILRSGALATLLGRNKGLSDATFK